MYALTIDLFHRAWDHQSACPRDIKEGLRRRVVELKKHSAAMVEATNPTAIARHEQRINELEREHVIAAETLEARAGKRRGFDEVFKLTLGLPANPCEHWENGCVEGRRVMLKIAFAHRLSYSRREGILNSKMSIVFRILDQFSPHKEVMAEREGL